MSNSVEVCETPEGKVYFDHADCVIWAEWNNGQKERWGQRGLSYLQKLKSFYMLSDQWEKANEVHL
jgi:hypothetical protein